MSRGNKNIARLKQWLSESEIFELDMVEGKLAREQIAEVTTSNDVIEEYMELNDHYLPIRYRENRPVYYLEDVEPKDEVILSKEDIDPRFLYIDEGINSSMDCGNLSIQCHSDYEFVYTPLKYKLPLRIDIEAKTDSSNLRIGYGEAQLIFNWEFGYYYFSCGDPVMRMAKIENSSNSNGYLKEDTFAKISWIIGREYIAVLVNDEVRLCKTGFPYQKLLKDDPSFTFRDQIRICSAFDSIVTIHSLQIIELE